MDISVVDLNRVEVYEAGASLITLLAYPREREEVWAQVHASLCNYALRIKSASEPDFATVPQPMKPIYAFRLQQDISRDLRTLERRIRDRMIAGRMGIGFLKEAVTGQVPAGLKRLSINELAELVLDDAGYSEPQNVETRIWRPSFAGHPFSHCASAPFTSRRSTNRTDWLRGAATRPRRNRAGHSHRGVPSRSVYAVPISAPRSGELDQNSLAVAARFKIFFGS
jgi:hypothetical protein